MTAIDTIRMSKYLKNEFGGFRIDNIDPILMTRLATGRPVPFGDNKAHLRTMASRLGLFQPGERMLMTAGKKGAPDECTTHQYAEAILKLLNSGEE